MQKTVRPIVLIAPIVLLLFCNFPQEPERFNHRPSMMKLIPGGIFSMGTEVSFFGLDSLDNDCQPVHEVTLDTFYMDSTEVTQELYWNLMEKNPSERASLYDPVENVSWFDAVLFCNRRSRLAWLDTVYSYSSAVFRKTHINSVTSCSTLTNLSINVRKKGYRLPTEAEWEYACRAGTTTPDYFGNQNNQDSVDYYAWFGYNSLRSHRRVGQKVPNNWGLYDMIGNVEEWCNDWYIPDYTPGAAVNPEGPGPEAGSTTRVYRGGSFTDNPTTAGLARSATRRNATPETYSTNCGFRCVLLR